MNVRTVLVVGGLGLVGYLLYRSLKQTVQQAVPRLQPGTPAGLIAQIQAGQYPGQDLRMGTASGNIGIQPINYGAGYTSIAGFHGR